MRLLGVYSNGVIIRIDVAVSAEAKPGQCGEDRVSEG